MALSVPLSRFTSRVGGGSAFYVRPLDHAKHKNTNTPKIKGIHIFISWLTFTLATTFWHIGFHYVLDVTGLSKDYGTPAQHGLLVAAFSLVSLVVAYFIYKFVVTRFILPKILFQNDSASSKPVA